MKNLEENYLEIYRCTTKFGVIEEMYVGTYADYWSYYIFIQTESYLWVKY